MQSAIDGIRLRLPFARWSPETVARLRIGAVLAVTFAVTRLIAWRAGLTFDVHWLPVTWQFIDTDLLTHRLLESVFYLHTQPPVFNLFLGIGLKIGAAAGHSAGLSFFHVCFVAMGASQYVCLYLLMRALGVSRRVAYFVSTAFVVSPSFLNFENWLFYPMLIATLVTFAALALVRMVAQKDVRSSALFFGILALLCGTHASFHLVYLLGALAAVLATHLVPRRSALLGALAPVLCVLALYAKNAILFGAFAASTWMGMNVSLNRVDAVAAADRVQLSRSGVLSNVAPLSAFLPITSYPPEYRQVPERFRDIPVLVNAFKANGAPNMNHVGLVKVSAAYLADTKAVLVNYPRVAWNSLSLGWAQYFKSSSDIWVVAKYEPSSLLGIERRFFDAQVYGVGLVPNSQVGLYLLGSILVFVGYGFVVALRKPRGSGPRASDAQRAVIAFCAATTAYSAIVSNTLNTIENERIRFGSEPLIVVLGACWLTYWLLPRLHAWTSPKHGVPLTTTAIGPRFSTSAAHDSLSA